MLSKEHVIFKRYEQASEGYKNSPKKDDLMVHENTIPNNNVEVFKDEKSSKKNMGENYEYTYKEKKEAKNLHSVESGSSSSKGNRENQKQY